MMIRPFREIEFEILQDLGVELSDENKHSFYIIASSEKGEYLEPYLVRTFDEAYQIFGDGNMIELIRSVYQVSGEVPISAIRVDWEEDYRRELVHLLRYLDFRYLLIDPYISFEYDMDFILSIIDIMKESLDHKSQLCHAFLSVDMDVHLSDIAELGEFLRGFYSYNETNAGIFISLILNQAKNFISSGLYAGLAISQSIDNTPRNKMLEGESNDIYRTIDFNQISKGLEESYENLGVVVMDDTYHKGPVFKTDVLLSSPDTKSQYRFFTNVKAVMFVLDFVKDRVERLRGQMSINPYEQVYEALRRAIEAILISGVVQDIEYDLEELPAGLGKNYHIRLKILPHFSVNYIVQKTMVSIFS